MKKARILALLYLIIVLNQDIFIPQGKNHGAVTGHKVVVRITDYGGASKKPEGQIVEIIGHINDPGVDIMSVIKAYQLPVEFPKDVVRELEFVPDEVDDNEIKERIDIRDMVTVTIDGADAKDLDDAISLSKEGDLYRLGVHISDVSHYIQEGTALDRDALKRGSSVYLVDRVIPMIPQKLSNGICSLNPGVNRLTLSCFMDINSKGKVVNHRIAKTVIRSNRRMTYKDVAKIIEGKDEEVIKKYEELVDMFLLRDDLAQVLKKQRHN